MKDRPARHLPAGAPPPHAASPTTHTRRPLAPPPCPLPPGHGTTPTMRPATPAQTLSHCPTHQHSRSLSTRGWPKGTTTHLMLGLLVRWTYPATRPGRMTPLGCLGEAGLSTGCTGARTGYPATWRMCSRGCNRHRLLMDHPWAIVHRLPCPPALLLLAGPVTHSGSSSSSSGSGMSERRHLHRRADMNWTGWGRRQMAYLTTGISGLMAAARGTSGGASICGAQHLTTSETKTRLVGGRCRRQQQQRAPRVALPIRLHAVVGVWG
mmetsp:Transcript_40673/g.101706  ORF Transcript_40673/g.101706 Transcript_40673/m.101706 type:complete len:266 (-) Transcript_40673:3297-4094(-)